MTRALEDILLEEMIKENEYESMDSGYVDAMDGLLGIDEETGDVDPDGGMLFPQPLN